MIESSTAAPPQLPRTIASVLEKIMKRRRTLVLLRGVSAVVAVAIALLLSIMAVDAAVTILTPAFRWSLTLAAVGVTALTAWLLLVRPLMKPLTLKQAAQLIDAHHPEFEERVTSAVDLLAASGAADARAASPALVAELARQATETIGAVAPKRELSLRKARPFLIAGCIAAALFAAIWVLWPREASRLLLRTVDRYVEPADVNREYLTVLPGNAIVTHGDRLNVNASVRGVRVRSIRLVCTDSSAKEVSQPMLLTSSAAPEKNAAPRDVSARQFAAALASVTQDFRYRVVVDGYVASPEFSVKVTTPPAVVRLDVAYEFPAYTGLPRRDERNFNGQLQGPAGTEVIVAALFNKPMAKAELLLDGKPLPRTDSAAEKAKWRFVLTPEIAGQWQVRIEDEHGFKHETPLRGVRTLSDAPPQVAIVEPASSAIDPGLKALRLRPNDRLPIAYRASDEWGIAAAELIVEYSPDRQDMRTIALPVASELESGAWLGSCVLDFGDLPISNGQRINVYVQVSDALPREFGGPQRARSEPLPIVFDFNASRLANQHSESRIQSISTRLHQALEALNSAKGQLHAMLPAAEKEPLTLSQTPKNQLQAARTQTGKAEATLQTLADDEADSEFADIAAGAKNAALDHVSPARQLLHQADVADDKAQQIESLKRADPQLDAAIAAVKALIESLNGMRDELVRSRELIAEVGDLADEQGRLGRATEEALRQPTDEEIAAELLERLADAQQQIFSDGTDFVRDADSTGFNATPAHRQATEAARLGAGHLRAKQLDPAIQQGQNAAKQFDEAALKLKENPQSQRQPGAVPLEERASRLAQRQKNLNEALDAYKAGDVAKALAALQKDVADRAAQLAADSDRINKELAAGGPGEKKPDIKGPQMSPGNALADASEAAKKAAAELGHINNIPKISPLKFLEGKQSPSDNGGNPDGGQGTQGGGSNTGAGSSKNPSPSNNNINNTIAKGKNLGKATLTADALLNQQPGQNNGPSGGSGTELQADAEELLRKGLAVLMAENNPLAKGFGGFGGSAPDTDVPDTGPKEFAAQGNQLPNEPGGGKAGGSSGQGSIEPGQGGKLGAGNAHIARRLEAMGIAGDQWLKLPGDLREEMLQSAAARVPPEYRQLVRQYFQELARRGTEVAAP